MNDLNAAGLNMYRCSPAMTAYFMERTLEKGLVPFLQSSPGLGKSSMVRAYAKKHNLAVIDHRVSTSGPEDFSGLPDLTGDKAVHKPFEFLPVAGDAIPDGKDGWVLYLSEFNSGLPSVITAAYKVLLEREVGQKKLHDKVQIICDGNLAEDRAIVNELGTAVQSRVVWLEMFVDGSSKEQFEWFMMNVALPQGWDSRVVAYLNANREKLNAFDPNHTEKTYPVPRTWEFVSKLAEGYDIVPEDMPLFVGAVGATEGASFVSFCELFGQLPTLEDVLRDPRMAPMPQDTGKQYAMISRLIDGADDTNISTLADYVEQFPLEFRILFWRSVQLRYPSIRRSSAFNAAQTSLARYLFSED